MTAVESMAFAIERSNLLRAHAMASQFDPHMHSTYSVVVLKRGTVELRSKRWSGAAHAGEVFFFNPFEVHAGRASSEPADYDVLYPSERTIGEYVGNNRHDGWLAIETRVLSRSRETEALIDVLSKRAIDPPSIELALRAILQRCTFTHEVSAPAPTALARKACRWIHQNYMRAIRTEEVANRIGVHKSHFIRAFKYAMGVAPETYIRQLRIAKAQELICARFELSDVAQSLGFCDQAHLSREFKKVFGVPPGVLSRGVRATWRQSCKNDPFESHANQFHDPR
jgi:AraC-like DNA-binding protein